MRRSAFVTAWIGVALLGWVGSAQAGLLVWDVADDWSTANNPNGAWTYGRHDAGSASFVPFTVSDVQLDGKVYGWHGLDGWAPSVAHNWTDETVDAYGISWAPHSCSAGPMGGPTIYRWTAPESGTYHVEAAFTDIQPYNSASDAAIWHDTSFLVYGTPRNGPVTYSADLELAAGAILDFNVLGGSSETRVEATITAVPEPSVVAMLAGALLGLVCYAWRRRR